MRDVCNEIQYTWIQQKPEDTAHNPKMIKAAAVYRGPTEPSKSVEDAAASWKGYEIKGPSTTPGKAEYTYK
jgi:hypothetical protein